MQPLDDPVPAEAALQRFAGRPVYIHAESIPGTLLRNVRADLVQGYVRGQGTCRVALRCRQGWVRVEGLQQWGVDVRGHLIFQGMGDGDPRLRHVLEIGLQPFPEPVPEDIAIPAIQAAPLDAPPAVKPHGVRGADRTDETVACCQGGSTRGDGRAPDWAGSCGAPRLLVVLAHPDDETFICGGALAAFAAAGGDIHLVCATRGEHGRRLGDPPSTTREGLPIQREAELREACRALGIRGLHLLGLRDKFLEFEDPEALAARVAWYIRHLRPDAVLTFHEARGGHPDHCTIGRAATLAWRRASDPSWHPEQLKSGAAPHRSPRLYYLAGVELAKDPAGHSLRAEQITTVACRDVGRQKMLAFRAHCSQTQMDRDLWQPDEERVCARFAQGREYFQQAEPPFTAEEQGLLGLQPAHGHAPANRADGH